MSRKSIKLNYFFNLAQQILVLLTPLITAPYTSRILGANGIGIYSYALSIISYFTLFSIMGTTTYGQREISYNQDNIEKRTEIFWNIISFRFITTILCLVIYFLMLFSIKEYKYIFYILSINIISAALDISWFFQGLEDFARIVTRNIIIRLWSVIFIFVFVHKKDDLLIYILGLSVSTLVSNLSLWPFLRKLIKKPVLKNIRPFNNFKTILSLFIPTIAISIYTVLDKTMIGLITKDAYENGYYEQAIKISKMLLTVVTSLGTVMIPRIGYHFEKHDTEIIENYMYRSYQFVWFLGLPLCLGLIAVVENFVPWFYGDGYLPVIPLLQILSLLLLAIGINNVTGVQYLIPSKKQNIFTLTVIIGSVTNLFANAILIPILNSLGAAIASVLAETVIAIVQIIIVRKELKPLNIVKSGINYIISGGIMFLAVVILSKKLMPSPVNTFILVALGIIIYAGILIILKDKFFIQNISKILKKLHVIK